MEKVDSSISKVYFVPLVDSAKFVDLYKAVGLSLPGKVAVKIHSGEHDREFNLQLDFIKPLLDYVKGTIVECNTAYPRKARHLRKALETITRA